MHVRLTFTETAARDLVEHKLNVDEVKQVVAETIEKRSAEKRIKDDFLQCESGDIRGKRYRITGGILESHGNKAEFECMSIIELHLCTTQNPDGTETVEWVPQNDGVTLHEYIEQHREPKQVR